MVGRRKVSVATSVARFSPQTSPRRKVRRKVPVARLSQGSVARFVARSRRKVHVAFQGGCFTIRYSIYIYIYTHALFSPLVGGP